MANFFKNIHPLLRRKRKPKEESDTNYAILNAINTVLEEVEEETIKSKIQSSLKTATDSYLDSYGSFFGVFRRRDSETDTVYRERIVESLDVPRGTNQSIKTAIRRYLEDNTIGIEVYEPWKDIFYLNDADSRLDGEHSFQGEYYTFAVIDIFIGSPFGEDIVSLIRDYKPAGVTIHTTYDPGIANIDASELVDWGSVPYTDLKPGKYETTTHIYLPLEQNLAGNIRMSDMKYLNDIFNLNFSNLGSEDVLTGGYGNYNRLLHLASTGNFTPKDNTLMDDVARDTNLVHHSFYEGRDGIDNNTFEVSIRPTDPFYVTINVDSLFGTRHPNLKRFKGEYGKALENSAIQLSYETERGNTFILEAFNFIEGEWFTIDQNLSNRGISAFSTNLENAYQYLNGNKLLFIRVRVPKDLTLKINHFYMGYNSPVRTEELGHGLKVLTEKPEITNPKEGISSVTNKGITDKMTLFEN